jgi:hypothetical protein
MKTTFFVLLTFVLPLALNFLNSELTAWVPRWTELMLQRAAAKIRDPKLSEQLLREWIGELEARPGALWKLKYALPIVLWGCSQIASDVQPRPSSTRPAVAGIFRAAWKIFLADFRPVFLPTVAVSLVISAAVLVHEIGFHNVIIPPSTVLRVLLVSIAVELICFVIFMRRARRKMRSNHKAAQL